MNLQPVRGERGLGWISEARQARFTFPVFLLNFVLCRDVPLAGSPSNGRITSGGHSVLNDAS